MSSDTTATFIAFLALIVVVLAPVATGIITLRNTHKERKEIRYRTQRDHMLSVLDRLIKLRGELQILQAAPDETDMGFDRERAYGEAYAIMLSANDDQLVVYAKQVMEGARQYEKPGSKKIVNEKLDAIDSAIQRLGERVDSLLRERLE